MRVPIDSGYAELLVLHDRPKSGEILCAACGNRFDVDPLRVEWDEGSEKIADFVSARAHVVVREAVLDEIATVCRGWRKGAVEMPDHPNLRRPLAPGRGAKRRVWLPYEGPQLVELVPTLDVEILPQSTVVIDWSCQTCGRIVYKAFNGIERRDSRTFTPRVAGQGLFFENRLLTGAVIFRPKYSGLLLCSDGAREFIQSRGYSNIEFLEVGELVG